MNANTRVLDPLVLGFWRLLDWQITPQENLRFLKQVIELGIRAHSASTPIKSHWYLTVRKSPIKHLKSR